MKVLAEIGLICLAALAVSCSNDASTPLTGIGTLTVSLNSRPALMLPSGQPAGVECDVPAQEDEISLSMTDASGRYAHTWERFAEFTQNDSYFAGDYTLEAVAGTSYEEGYGTPSFTGSATVTIAEGERTDAVIDLRPASAFFRVSLPADRSVAEVSASLHTPGGRYIPVSADPTGTSLLNLRPADTELLLDVATPDGASTRFIAATLPATEPATLYRIAVTAADGILSVATPEGISTFPLTPEFMDAEAPVVTIPEAIASSPLSLPEGDTPETPVTATVTAGGTPLRSLILTFRSRSLADKGLPLQVDLLHLTPEERAALTEANLVFDISATGGTVDYTSLLANLVYRTPEEATSSFTLLAIDAAGRTSAPVEFTVVTVPVDIVVLSATPAVMGVDRTTLSVRCPAPGFATHVEVEVETSPSTWEKTPVSVNARGEGLYDITLSVPEGSSPAAVRVLYCDEVRSTLSVPREMPQFTLTVDLYAKSAAIRIDAADPDLTGAIVRGAIIYVDGEPVPVYTRDADKGILTVIGLKPSTTYSFKATMMEGVTDIPFTPSVKATTESTRQLGNADFEERTDGPTYKDMPSGGLYAQTSVDIFNWQHHTSFRCEVPKGWTTVNEKTFNKSSHNHNTWYMQPSTRLVREDAGGGSFSALITSVGFDPQGAPIPPYAQQGQPYLDYSPVIPEISYRAAGRLFLGSYSFDPSTMTETYKEGASWSTRPISLNGYYRFMPSSHGRDDRGLASIEILGTDPEGKEITIASGTLLLPLASSFTAFSIPLSYYQHFGVKAKRIKVMFASSAHIGTIEEETASVMTDSDPVTASSTGGQLWIDNLVLAY